MKLVRSMIETAGWHINDHESPIHIGVKFGNFPLGQPHYHKKSHEYFLVLHGKIILSVNNQRIELEKGDLLIIDPKEPHKLMSKSSDAHFLLLMPRPDDEDKVNI